MIRKTASTPVASFGSFTIDRFLNASPGQVYAAWATEEGRKRWFSAPSDQWQQVERKFDFRVGGHDRLVGKWQSGMVTEFDSVYRDIVPNQRIIYVYDLVLNGKKISVSMATVEIRAEGTGSRMMVTEQGVFLDGYQDAGSRERGTNAQMDQLESSLVALAE